MSISMLIADSPFASDTKTKLIPQDVFEEMYVAFANLLVTDKYIQELLTDKSYVFDFMPFDRIRAIYERPPLSTIPKDTPHIQLTINRLAYSPQSSCSKYR